MDTVDPHAIIGSTLVDPTGKHAVRISSLIGSGSFAHVYLAEEIPLGSSSSTTSSSTTTTTLSPQATSPSYPSSDGRYTPQPTPPPSEKRAVKRLFKAGLDARQLLLQRQEAEVMKAIDPHQNVIQLLATVEDEECLYLIMEYCELDLYEAITQQGGFPDDVVKEVFGQIADAVLHCHASGFYHRDLKPENCLISTANYKVKLADFGLATTEPWSTEMGCGSVRYMAPECFEAHHNLPEGSPEYSAAQQHEVIGYSPAANDVWALGVILLNLLFGKNPWFEAHPTDAIFNAYAGANPNILRQQFNLSPQFDAILRRAFELDPRRRCSVMDLKLMVDSVGKFTGTPSSPPVPQVPHFGYTKDSILTGPGLILQPGVPLPLSPMASINPAATIPSIVMPVSPTTSQFGHPRPASAATTIFSENTSVIHHSDLRSRRNSAISANSEPTADAVSAAPIIKPTNLQQIDASDTDSSMAESDSIAEDFRNSYRESLRRNMADGLAERMMADARSSMDVDVASPTTPARPRQPLEYRRSSVASSVNSPISAVAPRENNPFRHYRLSYASSDVPEELEVHDLPAVSEEEDVVNAPAEESTPASPIAPVATNANTVNIASLEAEQDLANMSSPTSPSHSLPRSTVSSTSASSTKVGGGSNRRQPRAHPSARFSESPSVPGRTRDSGYNSTLGSPARSGQPAALLSVKTDNVSKGQVHSAPILASMGELDLDFDDDEEEDKQAREALLGSVDNDGDQSMSDAGATPPASVGVDGAHTMKDAAQTSSPVSNSATVEQQPKKTPEAFIGNTVSMTTDNKFFAPKTGLAAAVAGIQAKATGRRTPPPRRSPSPRQWFAPLMVRESPGRAPALGLPRFTVRRAAGGGVSNGEGAGGVIGMMGIRRRGTKSPVNGNMRRRTTMGSPSPTPSTAGETTPTNTTVEDPFFASSSTASKVLRSFEKVRRPSGDTLNSDSSDGSEVSGVSGASGENRRRPRKKSSAISLASIKQAWKGLLHRAGSSQDLSKSSMYTSQSTLGGIQDEESGGLHGSEDGGEWGQLAGDDGSSSSNNNFEGGSVTGSFLPTPPPSPTVKFWAPKTWQLSLRRGATMSDHHDTNSNHSAGTGGVFSFAGARRRRASDGLIPPPPPTEPAPEPPAVVKASVEEPESKVPVVEESEADVAVVIEKEGLVVKDDGLSSSLKGKKRSKRSRPISAPVGSLGWFPAVALANKSS
ncbi:hypothetical protein HDU76_003508 [Blyttiomyces sp. JEL0837]|nr:hypothetical protein HDU76_003508 [Blyttiomyces sp. JEL0837]